MAKEQKGGFVDALLKQMGISRSKRQSPGSGGWGRFLHDASRCPPAVWAEQGTRMPIESLWHFQ